MLIDGKNYLTVWEEDKRLFIIDQNELPFAFKIRELKNLNEALSAIKKMQVRGAPAIGATASLAYALALIRDPLSAESSFSALLATRPTAVDLHNALRYVRQAFLLDNQPQAALEAARHFCLRSIAECQAIGKYGNELIQSGCCILTHCNAGALAAVDFGTALAPIRVAHRLGKSLFVYVDETRPRLQGARLTAWELAAENIPHAVIVDNAAGFYLHQGKINLVITGADRIARNGDTANKIGTYTKAVLAHENGVPFYIAAPWSTFDSSSPSGEHFTIEERNPDEVLTFGGIPLTSGKSPALNPAFDITPARYISGFITPAGIFSPQNMAEIWKILTRV